MSKKKVLMIVGIIILLLLIIFIISVARKYIIINKLAKTKEEFFSSSNYSYSFMPDSNKNVVCEYFYKDGKNMEIWKTDDNIDSIIWYDETTKEHISINAKTSTAIVSHSETYEAFPDSVANTILSSVLPDKAMDKIKIALTFSISTKEIDGEKCYVLQPFTGIVSNTYYFDKENQTISKTLMGENNNVRFENWTLNQVTDENVARPDLTSYNTTYSE